MRNYSRYIGRIIVFGSLLALSACKTPTTVSRIAPYSVTTVSLEAGLSPQDQARVSKNCIFGLPKLDPGGHFGPTDLIAREGYVLIHSATDKIPLFVCEHVTADHLAGHLSRDDKFQPDPLLKPGRRAELKDYARTGYDRGHQAPAGDQTTDATLKAETFYLSNIAPQVPMFNRQIWKQLETLVRDWARERGEAFIITGAMFYDPKEESPVTATGIIQHKIIGADAVAVPTHFYKIVAARDAHGVLQTIAFVLENKSYPKPKKHNTYHFENYIQTIDWIQKRTGLNFMPELDPVEEKRLEKQPSPMWN